MRLLDVCGCFNLYGNMVMKEYIKDTMRLYNGDCMEGMKQYPDNYFDLAIVDPPYGIKRFKEKRKAKERGVGSYSEDGVLKWDNAPKIEYFEELFRISKNQIIWGANNFNLPPSEYFCVWNKKQTVDNFATAEYAYVSMGLKMPAKIFEYSIHQHNADKGKIHPTQKPVKLYSWLLNMYSSPEHKILDTHLGSASHAIAWHYFQKGGEFVGHELDSDYFDMSIKRIEQETAQISMF